MNDARIGCLLCSLRPRIARIEPLTESGTRRARTGADSVTDAIERGLREGFSRR